MTSALFILVHTESNIMVALEVEEKTFNFMVTRNETRKGVWGSSTPSEKCPSDPLPLGKTPLHMDPSPSKHATVLGKPAYEFTMDSFAFKP